MNVKRAFATIALATMVITGGASAASASQPERPATTCIKALKAYKRGDVSEKRATITCNRVIQTRRQGMRVVRWAERPGHRWALDMIS